MIGDRETAVRDVTRVIRGMEYPDEFLRIILGLITPREFAAVHKLAEKIRDAGMRWPIPRTEGER